MKIIGLTGGIGSGKSTVSVYVKEKGILVIDADQIAREITEPGGKILIRLIEAFGDSFLDENGELRRKALGSHVFGDKRKENLLNEITHNGIKNEIKARLMNAYDDQLEMVFIDAPLLIEVGMDFWCDETWLVTCDDEIRIQRVMARDGISEKNVRERIESQMDDREKREKADYIILNSGTKEALYQQIDELLG